MLLANERSGLSAASTSTSVCMTIYEALPIHIIRTVLGRLTPVLTLTNILMAKASPAALAIRSLRNSTCFTVSTR